MLYGLSQSGTSHTTVFNEISILVVRHISTYDFFILTHIISAYCYLNISVVSSHHGNILSDSYPHYTFYSAKNKEKRGKQLVYKA